MNPEFEIGDIMIITDHINLFPEHPLRGKNYEEWGPRFPDMSEAYSQRLIAHAKRHRQRKKASVSCTEVYVGTQGPTFETPAEYRYFHIIGGDAVGMSTVPESNRRTPYGNRSIRSVCKHIDLGVEGIVEKVSHEEVQKAAQAAQPKNDGNNDRTGQPLLTTRQPQHIMMPAAVGATSRHQPASIIHTSLPYGPKPTGNIKYRRIRLD